MIKGELITINREDAENILSMLDEAIEKLNGCRDLDDAIKVFGDRSISYERLIDKLEPVYKDLTHKELMFPEINTHQVTKEIIDDILNNQTDIESYGEPHALLWYYDEKSGKYIGCDNVHAHAWIEEFDTKEECIAWLLGEEEEDEDIKGDN